MYIIRRMSESSQLVMLYKARKVFNNHKTQKWERFLLQENHSLLFVKYVPRSLPVIAVEG